jgi:hypothetical protein
MSENLILTQPKPFAAAKSVAARYGVSLTNAAAEAIARAVLECADDELRVSCEVAEYLWGIPDAMRALDESLNRQMVADLVTAKVLPAALPRRVVAKPSQPWELIKVELVVPVRRPLPASDMRG